MVLLRTCCDIEPAGWRTEDECLMISINLYWWINKFRSIEVVKLFYEVCGPERILLICFSKCETFP
jgi:hypothetical protein